MHHVSYKGRRYPVYTESEAKAQGLEVIDREDIDEATEGDLLATGGGYVIEVVSTGVAGDTPWVRTPCGTYPVRWQGILDAEPRENIYSFSGKNPGEKLSHRAFMFARLFARTGRKIWSYRQAFPKSNDTTYIRRRCNFLLGLPEVRDKVSEELINMVQELKIDRGWSVSEAKDLYDEISEITDKASEKNLAKFLGLKLRTLKFLDKFLEECQQYNEPDVEETFTMTEDQQEAAEEGKKTRRTHTIKVRGRTGLVNGKTPDYHERGS